MPSSPTWCQGSDGFGVCPGLFTGGFYLIGLSEVGLYGLDDP